MRDTMNHLRSPAPPLWLCVACVAAVTLGGCAYDLTDRLAGPAPSDAGDLGASGDAASGGDAGASCVSGEAVFCACAGGELGVQVCSEGAFTPCDCSVLGGGGGGDAGSGGGDDMGADVAEDPGTSDVATPGPDLGAADADASFDAGIAWVPTCTSGRHWINEEDEPGEYEGGREMTPGRACVSCHEREREGPRLELGGTVFPAYHDEDDCYGVSGAIVRIFAANGAVYTFTSNRAGNFYAEAEDLNVALPYTAEVEYDGVVWPMETPQTNLDCNSCHSVAGAEGAVGRIVIP